MITLFLQYFLCVMRVTYDGSSSDSVNQPMRKRFLSGVSYIVDQEVAVVLVRRQALLLSKGVAFDLLVDALGLVVRPVG